MSNINIPKDNLDPFYRYQRSIIQSETNSKNGGTTILTNLDKIAKDIYRTTDDLIKVLKKQLATSIQFKNNCIIIKGYHKAEVLDNIIEDYIKNNVLCELCGNPETLPIGKNQKYQCQACGNIRR